jgi:hypothetical protein
VAGALRPALGTMVAASAAPYGFTLSIWCSGAMLFRAHGVPRAGEILGFLAGALVGFALMGLLAQRALYASAVTDHAATDRVLAGGMHWLAAGSAVLAALLLSQIDGWIAWPLVSLAATTLYILGASLQLALVTTRRSRG